MHFTLKEFFTIPQNPVMSYLMIQDLVVLLPVTYTISESIRLYLNLNVSMAAFYGK